MKSRSICPLFENGYNRETANVGPGNNINSIQAVQKFNNTVGDHRFHKTLVSIKFSIAQTEDTTVHTAGNSALKFDLNEGDPVDFEVDFQIPAADGDVVSLWGYYQKTTAASNFDTSPTVTLVADEANADINESASIVDENGVYKFFTMGGTKTDDGFVTVVLKARKASGGSGDIFFDDVRIVIGDAIFDIGQKFVKGKPIASFAGLSSLSKALNATASSFNESGTIGETINNTEILADDAATLSAPR